MKELEINANQDRMINNIKIGKIEEEVGALTYCNLAFRPS